jgi:TolB protein
MSRTLIVSLLALAAPLEAQRAPVLRQIQVPHPYYYREMYLPQLTTGPSAVTWSPDGKYVIYSMRGSLWRQRLGTTTAEQVTAGHGYDYQPDWSPDGRFVAFVRYENDAMELELLDLERETVAALTHNGAVNVDPRWSPDGTRLAFVSTAFKGRWHVNVMTLNGGEPKSVERITTDRDSGLPRYYYSPFDHYLSPTWSPDGRELIVISNRNHIWGTGGFWRIPAHPADSGREIHYEETTWKARPDWSHDGRRVVYSSYIGRQWNQLWLMTSDGGDPFQLTYGDFDATSPRWSRDGTRIAYISNEGGNTSLWIIDVPGGRRERIEATALRFREPVGRLTVEVVDSASERPLGARVSVTAADGRAFAPSDAWMHADDAFDRSVRRFEVGYFHSRGRSTVTVPAGRVTVDVTRGLEYEAVQRVVELPRDGRRLVRVALSRIDNLPARGWYSGDLHVHMNYGGSYRNEPRRLAFQARAEDLHVVEDLIVNKEQRVPDIELFSGRPDPVSSASTLIAHDQEYHTSYWGHTGLLGLKHNVLLPAYAAYVNTAAASLYPANANVLDLAHAQGGIGGYVHPFDEYPQPANDKEPLTHELPVDVALGKVDYMEIVGFSDHLTTAKVWYQLLNCGFRISAGAGTDAMANFASLRGPVGMNRVFVRTGSKLSHERFLAALKVGRTFATNGPLLHFTLGGKDIGDELRLPAGRHTLEVRAELRSIVPVDHLELVSNGKVVAEFPLGGRRTSASIHRTITIDHSGWYTLRAWSDHATPPVLDIYPFATTSPIYVIVDGQSIRSAEDASYFQMWVERLVDGAKRHEGWNSQREKEEVLRLLEAARDEYRRRATAVTAGR